MGVAMKTDSVAVFGNSGEMASVFGKSAGNEMSSRDAVFELKLEDFLGVGGRAVVDGEIDWLEGFWWRSGLWLGRLGLGKPWSGQRHSDGRLWYA